MQLIDVGRRVGRGRRPQRGWPKIARIADLLRRAGDEDDANLVAVVVSWLSGELPQRQIGVGWAALRSLPPRRGTLAERDAGRCRASVRSARSQARGRRRAGAALVDRAVRRGNRG